jgi:hypothetical protein
MREEEEFIMSQTTGLHAAANFNSRKSIAMSTNSLPNGAANGNVAGGRLPTDDEIREIAASLRGLRFGSVNIVIQDGVIIQIDRTEKKRLRNRRESNDSSQT